MRGNIALAVDAVLASKSQTERQARTEHYIKMVGLAHAFARLATGVGLSADHARAARRLRAAVAAEPYMVGGAGRFDTRVMERLGERVFCKVGAEGMHCAALPELGLGVAVKVDDGNNARACEVAMAALIETLLPLTDADAAYLHGFSDLRLSNWNGIEVGRLQATSTLRKHD